MNHLSTLSRPVSRPRGRRGQRTRQRLLDAAEAAFGGRGYFETSIADITRRARVAQGTFYVYFSGKRAVFAELVRERSRELRRMIQGAVRGIDDRREVERAGFVAFFRFIHGHRNMYRIVRQAEFIDPPLFRWYYRRFAQGYAAGLQEAARRGQLRPLDPEVLAYCLMGIGDFLGMRWVLWEEDGPKPRVVDTMMDFMLHGIDAAGRAAAPTGEASAAGGRPR